MSIVHAGAKRADVAKKSGVAESTVSRALSGSALISAAVREKVQRVAREMRYVPSKQALHFARNKTFRLGFVIPVYRSFPTFSRAYFPALLDGAVRGAEERGYLVTIVCDSAGDQVKDLSHMVHSREVDGLLLAITQTGDKRVEQLRKDKLPFVVINGRCEQCCSVDNNPQKGMRLAFEYLAGLGHRRVGYVSGDMRYSNAVDRRKVFEELAGEFGIEYRIAEGNFSRTSGYYCAGRLLQQGRRPSLILTACDRDALGVLSYCRDHGIAVPEELSLIGYDNSEICTTTLPALTSIHNPITEIGRESARLLIESLEGRLKKPKRKVLDTGFVVRDSSGKRKEKG